MMEERLDREEILQRLVCGDLDPESPQARAAFEVDTSLRAEYEQLKTLASSLDGAAKDVDETFGSMPQDAPGVDRVPAILERIWTSERRGFRHLLGHRGVQVGIVLAAAAALWLVLSLLPDSSEHSPSPGGKGVELGHEIDCIAPRGPVESYGTFSWTGRFPPGCTFEIRIRDLESGSEQVISSVSETHWTPSPSQLRELPRKMEWSVSATCPGWDQLELEGSARASLED